LSIESDYNTWADQYDTNDNKTRDLDRRVTIQILSKYNFKKILELGCGTGKNTVWLLNKAEKIIGIDFSDNMLEIAKRKVTDNRVTFIKGDINDSWNLADHSVDLITSSLTLEHIDNLFPIFKQANKKLINGGLFFVSEFHPYKQYKGSGAKFDAENGLVQLQVYTHHVSEFAENALTNGFEILEIKEFFDDTKEDAYPRIISFVFRKIKEMATKRPAQD